MDRSLASTALLTRRRALRLLGGAALAAVPAVPAALAGRGAAADGIIWCRADPVVRLGGTRVQFWVSVPEANEASVTGPIACRVQTPRTVARAVESTDAGFGGYGETVVFGDMGHPVEPGQPFPVAVWVDVPNAKGGKFPIVVEVVPENGEPVVGTGNAGSTTLKLTVTPTP